MCSVANGLFFRLLGNPATKRHSSIKGAVSCIQSIMLLAPSGLLLSRFLVSFHHFSPLYFHRMVFRDVWRHLPFLSTIVSSTSPPTNAHSLSFLPEMTVLELKTSFFLVDSSARVGNELGANSPFFARLATQVAGGLSTILGAMSATVLVLARHQIGRLFTDNSDLLKLIASILPLVAICHLGDSPQTTLSGALRGMAR
jgi:hypothetical protein